MRQYVLALEQDDEASETVRVPHAALVAAKVDDVACHLSQGYLVVQPVLDISHDVVVGQHLPHPAGRHDRELDLLVHAHRVHVRLRRHHLLGGFALVDEVAERPRHVMHVVRFVDRPNVWSDACACVGYALLLGEDVPLVILGDGEGALVVADGQPAVAEVAAVDLIARQPHCAAGGAAVANDLAVGGDHEGGSPDLVVQVQAGALDGRPEVVSQNLVSPDDVIVEVRTDEEGDVFSARAVSVHHGREVDGGIISAGVV